MTTTVTTDPGTTTLGPSQTIIGQGSLYLESSITFSSLTSYQKVINLTGNIGVVIVNGQHSLTPAASGQPDNFYYSVGVGGVVTLTDTNTGFAVTITGASDLIFNGGAQINGNYTSIAYIGNSVQSSIAELYYGALGRQPDLTGVAYYNTLAAQGVSLTQIAADFLASPEFSARFGSNVSDSQFVTALYQNVLHRSPGASELTYYTNALSLGELGVPTSAAAPSWSRSQELLNFISSAENQQNLAGTVINSDLIGANQYAYLDNAAANVTFAKLSGVNSPSGDVVISNGVANQAITVSGDSQLSILDNAATSLTVIGSGTASDIAINAPSVKSLTILGGSHVTLDLPGANYASLTSLTIANSGGVSAYVYNAANLTAINASASTGTNSLSLSGSQSYIGGSGQSIIDLTSDDLSAPINGGSATNNELILSGPKFTVAGIGAQAKNFSIAGFDALSAATSYDVSGGKNSLLSGITSVDIINPLPNSVSFLVAQNANLTIEAGATSPIVFQSADSSGVADSMTLTLGKLGSLAAVTGSLTLEDSESTPVGIGTVNLVSNGTGSVNAIAILNDTALATLNISGNDGVTIGAGAFTDDTAAALTINNVNTGVGPLGLVTFKTLTDNSLTSLTVTGSNAITFAGLTDAVSGTLTIVDSDSAPVDIQALSGLAATTLTVTNSGPALLTVGDVTGVGVTALTSLNLNGAIAFTLASDTVTSGTNVNGASDNANVSITLSGTASGSTDNIVLGNGVDLFKTAGSGSENVTLGNGGTAANPNVVDLTGSTAVDVVKVGSGMNVVAVGTGTETVSFGSHVANANFYDSLVLTSTTATFSSNTSATQSSIVTSSGMVIVNGLVAGDKISLPIATDSLATATNLAGVNGEVVFAHGTYSAGSFTYNPLGHDSLLTYDGVNGSTHPLVSVVLVGVSYGAGLSENYNGVITLG